MQCLNAVIECHKRGKVMLKLQNGWYEPSNGVEDSKDVPGDQKPPWPTRAWKITECPLPSISQKKEGKAATKHSPKLQNLGYCSRCEQFHHAPGVEGRFGGEALQDAASPGAYGQSCGHKSPKMQRYPPRDGRRHPCWQLTLINVNINLIKFAVQQEVNIYFV